MKSVRSRQPLGLLLASRVGLGSWDFVGVYAAWARADDGQPNTGLWWYVLAEAFPPQRPHFVAALHVVPQLCVLPLALRLRGSSPLVAACVAAALGCAFRPYPCAPDAVFGLALLGSQLTPGLRRHTQGVPPALVACVAALGCLAPLRAGWLERRALNANFVYAATVGLGAGQAWLLYDVAAAALSRDVHAITHGASARVQRAWRRRRVRRGDAREGVRTRSCRESASSGDAAAPGLSRRTRARESGVTAGANSQES